MRKLRQHIDVRQAEAGVSISPDRGEIPVLAIIVIVLAVIFALAYFGIIQALFGSYELPDQGNSMRPVSITVGALR